MLGVWFCPLDESKMNKQTKLMLKCAEMMKLTVIGKVKDDVIRCAHCRGGSYTYDPLIDDTQAMAMVKAFKLVVIPLATGGWSCAPYRDDAVPVGMGETLNEAICNCVGKME